MNEILDSDYEYTSEDRTLQELTCPICNEIFQSPVSVHGCHHSFCKECIDEWLGHERTCPVCRKKIAPPSKGSGGSSKISAYSEINTRIVSGVIDAQHVRCKLCKQTNIERCQWDGHVNICPKKVISCLSTDNLCTWEGTRDSLAQHLQVCPFEQLRPILDETKDELRSIQSNESELRAEIEILKEKVTLLLNIVNYGDLMKKKCRRPFKCKYRDRSNRKAKFPCKNCHEAVGRKEVLLHTCNGKYICSSCVESQYLSNESDFSADTSEEDN